MHRDSDIAYAKCSCGRRMTQGRYLCDYCEKHLDWDPPSKANHSKAAVESVFGEGLEMRGRRLPMDEFKATLKLGNWTEGSIWRKGIQFGVICGENGKPQRVVWT